MRTSPAGTLLDGEALSRRTGVLRISPGTLAFLDSLRPPMEMRCGADEVGVGLQRHAALGVGVLQVAGGGDVPVDQHRVRQWPQMLGWLQLGRIEWQEPHVDMLGHPYLGTVMPARTALHQHDLFGWTRSDRLCQGFQLDREELDSDRRRQMPYRARSRQDARNRRGSARRSSAGR